MEIKTAIGNFYPFSIASPGANWNSLDEDYAILANSVPILRGIRSKEAAIHLLELICFLDQHQLTNSVLSTLDLSTKDSPIDGEVFLLAHSKYCLTKQRQ